MSRSARVEARPAREPRAAPARASAAPALHALAAVLVAGAVGWSEGMYDPFALALVTAAALLVALAARAPDVPRRLAEHGPAIVLGLGVAGGLSFDALFLPGILVEPRLLGPFRPALAVLAAILATHLWPRPPRALALARTPLAVAAWLVVAGIVLRASPAPAIDVWQLQQQGAVALLRGQNPYALAYPNPYGPATTLLAPEVLTPDRLFIRTVPYPPLSLLTGAAAVVAAGDVRWALSLATAAAALLVWLLGRRARTADLAAAFLLVQPRTLMVMELSWTEPLVLATVLALALAVRSREVPTDIARPPAGWIAAGVASGFAVASKQYALLVALPLVLLLERRDRLRVLVAGAAVAAAIHVPFLLADPGALWLSMVRYQIAQPFRPDALSWPAAVVALGGPRLPAWPAFILAFLAAYGVARRARSVAEALGAGALGWLVLILGSKQAFANYYWLVAGLLCAAAAAAAAPAPLEDERAR